MSNLLIVESPTKVKTIKKYLGTNFKVMASMGHVRDLPKSKLGLLPEKDFEPQYITIRGKAALINELKKEAKAAKKVYLATDPDREGEAISWHLATLLDLDTDDNIRVTFNEITKKSVLEAIKNPRRINMDLVDAQQARRVLDRLVGYGISPILWKRIRKGLSAGRVQSVATRLIVDREEEIEAFKPEEYWKLSAILNPLGKEEAFIARFHGLNGKKITIKNEQQAKEIEAAIKVSSLSVEKLKAARREKTPPPPFTTSTLQQEASRILNMTSKRTMQIAQNLYEGVDIPGHGQVGLITYMRTDSLRISEEALADVRGYIKDKYGAEYCPKSPRYYKTKSGAQDAHEAIRPTSLEFAPDQIRSSLTGERYKLYKLIWDRFAASQMAAQVYDTVNADISAKKDGKSYWLKAQGSSIVFKGYTVLYQEAKPEKEDAEDGSLPELSEGEALSLKETQTEQKFTQPPSRYTEAALIKALEEYGIGRPSTYAPTISTILQREYIIRDGKVFKPTKLGMVTTDFMRGKFADIVNTEFTARMETGLDSIEEGRSAWVDIVREFNKSLEESKKAAEAEADGGRIKVPDEESDVTCSLCGKKMVVKSGRFGKFLACPGYPECKNTQPITHPTGGKCPKCGGEILLKFSKNGNKYYACENGPKCDFMTWYEPVSKKCETCGATMLKKAGFKGRYTLICSNEGCPTRAEAAKK